MTKEILGNVIADYTYSPSNRVTEINSSFAGFLGLDPETNTSMVQYEYDALGRRSSRTGYSEHEKHGIVEMEVETQTNNLYEGLGFNLLRMHSRAVRYERPGWLSLQLTMINTDMVLFMSPCPSIFLQMVI